MSKANETQVGGGHYKGVAVEHWDFVLMHNIPYMEAQIIKYAMRWRDKNGVEDLRKARHFIDKLIEAELQGPVIYVPLPVTVDSGNNYMTGDSGIPHAHGYVDQD